MKHLDGVVLAIAMWTLAWRHRLRRRPIWVVLDAQDPDRRQAFSAAAALAVREGRFAAVGSRRRRPDVTSAARPASLKDVDGRCVPGHHRHALACARTSRQRGGARSRSKNLQNRRRAAGVDPSLGSGSQGMWIWSPRVYPTRFREHRFPTREELDALAPDYPVVVDARLRVLAEHRGAALQPGSPEHAGSAGRSDRQEWVRRAYRSAEKRPRPPGPFRPRAAPAARHARDRCTVSTWRPASRASPNAVPRWTADQDLPGAEGGQPPARANDRHRANPSWPDDRSEVERFIYESAVQVSVQGRRVAEGRSAETHGGRRDLHRHCLHARAGWSRSASSCMRWKIRRIVAS